MNVLNFKIQNLKCYKIQNFLAASVFVIQISRVWGIWGVSDFLFGNVPPVKSIKKIFPNLKPSEVCVTSDPGILEKRYAAHGQ